MSDDPRMDDDLLEVGLILLQRNVLFVRSIRERGIVRTEKNCLDFL